MKISRRSVLAGVVASTSVAAPHLIRKSWATEKFVGKLAINQPVQTILVQGMLNYSKLVSERTNGAVDLRVFSDAQLGSDPQSLEQMRLGSVEASLPNASNLLQYVPEMAVTDFPFLFQSADHAQKAVSVIQDHFFAKLVDQGFYPLGGMNYGARDICSIEPITSIENIQGKKIRVIQSPTIVKAWQWIGANPTPIPSSEVYMALQTKLIDCAEFPASSYVSFKRYEVAKHWTKIGYLYSFQYLLLANDWVKKLPPEYLEIMKTTAAEVMPVLYEDAQKDEIKALEIAQSFGATVHEVTDRNVWVERVTPLYEEYATNTSGGQELLDKLRSIA